MCRKFVFNPCWNGEDNLSFYVNVKVLPEYKMWGHTEIAQELVHKMEVPRNKGKFICDMFGNPAEYIRDENGEYIWGEGIKENTNTIKKDRSRSIRRKSTENKKAHFRAIEPYTDSIRITRNGGVVRRGNTYEWHRVWQKIEIRLERHAGKKICRNYELQEKEIPETPDIPADELGGYWDVEKQKFIANRDDWDDDQDYCFEDGPEEYTEDGDQYNIQIPTANAAFNFIREHNLYDYFVEWCKAKEGDKQW